MITMCRSFTILNFHESFFHCFSARSWKRRNCKLRRINLNKRNRKKVSRNWFSFLKTRFCSLIEALEGFFPPPVRSILERWVGRLSIKLDIFVNISKVLFENPLGWDLILQITSLFMNIFPLLGNILDNECWSLISLIVGVLPQLFWQAANLEHALKKGGIVKGCSSEIFLNAYGKMRENAQLQRQETKLWFCVQEIETPWCHLLYTTISFHIEINMKNQTAAVLP